MMAMEAATKKCKRHASGVKRALQPRKTGSNYSGNYRGNRWSQVTEK